MLSGDREFPVVRRGGGNSNEKLQVGKAGQLEDLFYIIGEYLSIKKYTDSVINYAMI